MKIFMRKISYIVTALVLGSCLAASPVMARTHHSIKHHATKPHAHHTKHHARHAVSHLAAPSSFVRIAQTQLVSLGYLTAHPDGVLGPKTKTALAKFQGDHMFAMTGKLTTETYNALTNQNQPEAAATSEPPAPKQPDFYATHPDFYGRYAQQYADPMALSSSVAGNGASGDTGQTRSQAVMSRFAKIDVSENAQSNFKTYNVTINGKPLLRSDDQPSVIGISQTYNLSNEDAIIFSTYRSLDPICNYKHYLLIINSSGENVQEISNCTRGYQAVAKESSLFITFPEFDDNRSMGSVYRYENGSLQKL